MNEELETLYKRAEVPPINFAEKGEIYFAKTIELNGKRYPELSDKKQLELVKFLMLLGELSWTTSQKGKDISYIFYQGYEYSSSGFKDFPEALVSLINDMWPDLSNYEKSLIKEILK